ncbi:FG-GAP-like repeat-containing protein [Streptomyces zaomyceticus]|uniref:FG-GAP-like repeat-containing protein n=1 Tax=Streptomyces zaomyceticus TaxID=68286 RepID=UPI003720D74E
MLHERRGSGWARGAASALALALATAGLTGGTARAEGDPPGPLSTAFNDTVVGDGTGDTYSGAQLAAAGWEPGARVTVNGTTYTWPGPNGAGHDNVRPEGQTVSVTGRGDALGFLAAAQGGAAEGDGSVTYEDGTTSAYHLGVKDWIWNGADQSAPAVTLTDRTFSTGRPDRQGGKNVYAVTVPLDRGKTVRSVTLPDAPTLHVFSLAVRDTTTASASTTWTGSWGAALTPPEGMGKTPGADWPVWNDQTLRMVVNPHKSGATTRLRFANTFGFQPVTLGRVTVAHRSGKTSGAEGDPREVTFADGGTTIPAGGELVSEPLAFPVTAGRDLLVSVHLPGVVKGAPVHAYALSPTYAGTGDLTGSATETGFTKNSERWTLLQGVDVETAGSPGTVIALGDSQTDGGRTSADTNQRWPDAFARILGKDPGSPGVLNMGLSGNRILTDHGRPVPVGSGVERNLLDANGPRALNRLDRDVFAQPGVRRVVFYEGVNDVLHGGVDVTNVDAKASELIEGIEQVVSHVRARGIGITVATIPPFGCQPDDSRCVEAPGVDALRQKVNAHIRTLDDHVDFDRATRDAAQPTRLDLVYKCDTDDLHFNGAGTQRLAETLAAAVTGTSKDLSETAAADFDGDGRTDLLARDATSATLRVWFGRGDGSFDRSLRVTYDWNHTQTVAADLDGDGRADLLARTPPISPGSVAPELWMWPGLGDGHFGTSRRVTPVWTFDEMAVADFDLDGETDIIAAGESTDLLRIWAGTGATSAEFKQPRDVMAGWNHTQTVAGDFDGRDGADIMAKDAANVLTMWVRDADGSFKPKKAVTPGWTFTETTVGDFTEDGRTDIVARDADGTLKIWTGRGDTTFNAPRTAPIRW